MKKELLKGLSREQAKKIGECKSSEELLRLAKEEGVELTHEQLEAISGGACFGVPGCPQCGKSNNVYYYKGHCFCDNCGTEYEEDGTILVPGTPEHLEEIRRS